MLLREPPLSLYVHLPWCVRKCPYCDFNSFAFHGSFPQDAYVDALLADLAAQAPAVRHRPVHTVFFGGGTPSLFAPASIGRILDAAARSLALAGDAEITLEANPGTIEHGAFSGYRAAGINRVSLGGQSFAPAQLRALGRIHDAQDTRMAVAELRAAGLPNFNIDLMYGLPGQTVGEALQDIDCALALEPAHISHYQLTIEPGTVFAGTPPAPPRDDTLDMLDATTARLAAAGFARYEVSAYARQTRASQHNLNYWLFGDYLGIGAGAHGKISDSNAARIVRTARPREPRRYMSEATGPVARNSVTEADLPFEFMLNALRLVQGFEQSLYEERTGLDWTSVAVTLQQLSAEKLVAESEGRWRASDRGLLFLNDLLVRFLPAPR